ncbi:MAG: DUF308 domain-containing protein [Zunongwangia sp.]|uniref:HdeD family acid-resistance protein n=1 Tax=Zunongwangia sp. TaxID=1965325 RepID=UPI003242D270
METTLYNLTKHWYIPLIIGLLFVGVGIWVFRTPAESYLTLTLLFSISFLVSGIFEIFYSVTNRKNLYGWVWNLVGGIANAIIGILLLSKPEVSLIVFPIYIGLWLLFRSILAVGTSLGLGLGSGYLLVLGILGILFSFVLLWNPLFAGLTVVYWTGFGLLVFGIYNIIFSFQARKIKKHSENYY